MFRMNARENRLARRPSFVEACRAGYSRFTTVVHEKRTKRTDDRGDDVTGFEIAAASLLSE